MKTKRKKDERRRNTATCTRPKGILSRVRWQLPVPGCLTHFAVDDIEQITEAHILPKATISGPTTLLCKSCNNRHGRLQDKWFGEHLDLVLNKRSILGVKTQPGYFKIGGERVGGTFWQKPDVSVTFRYVVQRTAPEALRAVERHIDQANRNGELSGEIPIPLLEKQNQKLVGVGFLTAAYLMMFRELGYSWALQAHLDLLRQQIMNADADIFPLRISNPIKPPFDRLFAGTCRLNGEVTLAVGLTDRLVLLPPADNPGFFERVLRNDNPTCDQIREFRFYRGHDFDGPVTLLYGERVLVAPDVLPVAADWYAIFLPPDGSRPRIVPSSRVKLDIVPEFDKYTGKP